MSDPTLKSAFEAIGQIAKDRDDLVVLVSWMAEHNYTPSQIALAVEKPWNHKELLAEAEAELAANKEISDLRRRENAEEEAEPLMVDPKPHHFPQQWASHEGRS